MEWWFNIPVIVWSLWIFALGLMVGSFLNVLIARLPFEKSILWPSSRCFACYRKIRLTDNLPIIGYLRLGGKCRSCGAAFSRRYLWVELGTGVMFLLLFILDVVVNWHGIPGVKYQPYGSSPLPPLGGCVLFLHHAGLFSLLLAAAVIDAEHRIIPPLIPYGGALVGIILGTVFPWPWPQPATAVTEAIPPNLPWIFIEHWGKIPEGMQPWPFWGPLFAFAPAGSWQLGLLNGVIGALAGSLVVRWVKWLFEVGFGKEALGMGDADLMMLAGAFLGWQIAVLSLFVGAFAALLLKIPFLVAGAVRKAAVEHELPFGPGLALGVVVTWAAWPWLGRSVQFAFFDLTTLGVVVGVMSVGMLAAGLLLRRGDNAPAPEPVAK